MSTANIYEQIEKEKHQIMLDRKENLRGTNWKIAREIIDSLTTVGIIEREIDRIICRAEQRVRKNKRRGKNGQQ